jgi:hypothetical protein
VSLKRWIRDKPVMKEPLEWFAVGLGVLSVAGFVAILYLPPMYGPLPWLEAGPMLVGLMCALGPILLVVAAVGRRRVLIPFLIFGVLLVSLRVLIGQEERYWREHFVRTAQERELFLTFMRSQLPEKPLSWLDLPPELKGLSSGGKAYLFMDKEGRRFYSYAVFTHGVDNSTGFVFSESGNSPPRLAHPEITKFVPLGDGWFLFRST